MGPPDTLAVPGGHLPSSLGRQTLAGQNPWPQSRAVVLGSASSPCGRPFWASEQFFERSPIIMVKTHMLVKSAVNFILRKKQNPCCWAFLWGNFLDQIFRLRKIHPKSGPYLLVAAHIKGHRRKEFSILLACCCHSCWQACLSCCCRVNSHFFRISA